MKNHNELWKKIGSTILEEFNALHKNDYFDSGVKGRSGEGTFRNWLSRWLPKRVELLDGVVVDSSTKPTTQRDAIIFDSFHCPIFRHKMDNNDEMINILPIEGVKGMIEINNSCPSWDKIEKDMDKIAIIQSLKQTGQPDQKLIIRDFNEENSFNVHNQVLNNPRKFGFIFTQDYQHSLVSLAENFKRKNYLLGIDNSVDAIFVVNKGIILHGVNEGWCTTRINGSELYYMETEPWDVLLTMVALINKNLSFVTCGRVPEFEEYFRNTLVDRKGYMENNRKLVDVYSTEYIAQESKYYKNLD